jgi:hypothetical protein
LPDPGGVVIEGEGELDLIIGKPHQTREKVLRV